MEFRDGVIKVGSSFERCPFSVHNLRRLGVEVIANRAFYCCRQLEAISISSAWIIESGAFMTKLELPPKELKEPLYAVLPQLFVTHNHTIERCDICNGAFNRCESPTGLDAVPSVHKAVSSLHFDKWEWERANALRTTSNTLGQTDSSVWMSSKTDTKYY